MTQAPWRVRAVTHPRRPRVCCPGERAWTNADSAHSTCGGDGAVRLYNGGARAVDVNRTRMKGSGAARGDCLSTGLVDAPCIVVGRHDAEPQEEEIQNAFTRIEKRAAEARAQDLDFKSTGIAVLDSVKLGAAQGVVRDLDEKIAAIEGRNTLVSAFGGNPVALIEAGKAEGPEATATKGQ